MSGVGEGISDSGGGVVQTWNQNCCSGAGLDEVYLDLFSFLFFPPDRSYSLNVPVTHYIAEFGLELCPQPCRMPEVSFYRGLLLDFNMQVCFSPCWSLMV